MISVSHRDTPTGIEPHVTLAEAARLLGKAEKTLRHRLGKADPKVLALRPAKVLGRWRFPLAAIEEAYRVGAREATGMKRPVRMVRRRG